MIYAPRGVGKTHLALGCAYAVASGGTFLKWRAPRPRRVLLIDGEMPVVTLQERLDTIVTKAGEAVPEGFIAIMPYDVFPEGGPDLSTEEGQAELEPFIGDADLIVVDSISTICRGGKENEAESWAAIQAWALRQRRKGRTVLFVHHSGKSGDQRGTSKREDVMDTVIKLVRPTDYRAEDGARFIVEFTKNRGFMGPDAESFEAALSDGEWNTRAVEDTRTARILELHAEGLTQREMAKQLGIGLATVNRTIKRENGHD
jgi:RecA-family ATPase